MLGSLTLNPSTQDLMTLPQDYVLLPQNLVPQVAPLPRKPLVDETLNLPRSFDPQRSLKVLMQTMDGLPAYPTST